jgi:hypothetical protein
MKGTAFLTLAVLVSGLTAQAQDGVVIRTQKNGKQVITTIEPLTPSAATPGPVGQKLLADGGAAPVTLLASDWRCGRSFTDTSGRRWQLTYGPPLSTKPAEVSGWLVRPTDQRLYFFTASGSLYVNTNPVRNSAS